MFGGGNGDEWTTLIFGFESKEALSNPNMCFRLFQLPLLRIFRYRTYVYDSCVCRLRIVTSLTIFSGWAGLSFLQRVFLVFSLSYYSSVRQLRTISLTGFGHAYVTKHTHTRQCVSFTRMRRGFERNPSATGVSGDATRDYDGPPKSLLPHPPDLLEYGQKSIHTE